MPYSSQMFATYNFCCLQHLLEVLGNYFPSLHLFLSSPRKELRERAEELWGSHEFWPVYRQNSVRNVENGNQRGELPNIYGILHYVFISPTPLLNHLTSLSRRILACATGQGQCHIHSRPTFTLHMRGFHVGDAVEQKQWFETVGIYAFVPPPCLCIEELDI